ncbi:type VI secretion protein [Parashewanella curva]|uniref:Type VI secretion protein n=1 Tax=Parashewanella curva TaxID=2338552 RepID=A0A3L8Q0N6_9GAMM|nr:type VI secretion system ImpA family N-terminal domain-containing protein [Parashewanella curva]RLV61237.1 type VI secretion protein [Parashewanella curva]
MFTEQLKQELIQPISAEMHCGEYIKLDRSLFRPLRNSFNLAQTSLRKLSQNPDGTEIETLLEENTNNWEQLSQELLDIFKQSSRDIELIGWFLSAQLILDASLASFATAMEWLAELVNEQWDYLNPVLPENKLKAEDEAGKLKEQSEAKSKAFFQLVGDSEEGSLLYGPFLMLPLINEISFFHYQSVERKGEVSVLKQKVSAYVSNEKETVKTKIESLERALTAVERLTNSTFEHCRESNVTAPNFNFIKNIIKKFESAIVYLTGIKLNKKVAAADTADTGNDTEASKAGSETENLKVQNQSESGQSSSSEQIMLTKNSESLSKVAANNSMNRNFALHQLRDISDYFRQSEPHSPVSFLLEKAIRWGCMSLPDVIKEMMTEPEGGLVDKIFDSTGLNRMDQVVLPEVDEVNPISINQQSNTQKVSHTPEQQIQQKIHTSEPSGNDVTSNQQPKSDEARKNTALSW